MLLFIFFYSRKRRLLDIEGHSTTNLQMPLTPVISEPFHSSEERRMPKLHPLTPLKSEVFVINLGCWYNS